MFEFNLLPFLSSFSLKLTQTAVVSTRTFQKKAEKINESLRPKQTMSLSGGGNKSNSKKAFSH